MSRKSKTLRAFLHQTQNPTIEQAWEAAWKHAQKTSHARSMRDMREKLAATQAENERLRKDAERYRWLRDPSSGAERVVLYSRGDFGRGLMSHTMLDAAIDAAMQEEHNP